MTELGVCSPEQSICAKACIRYSSVGAVTILRLPRLGSSCCAPPFPFLLHEKKG